MSTDDNYFDAICHWLPEIDSLSAFCTQVNAALIKMSEKRVTLEEKMIRRYFHEVCIVSASIAQEVHGMLTSHYEAIGIESLDELRQLREELTAVVSDLQKVLAYNLNYLEQYFEYDYFAKLQNDDYVGRMRAIASSLAKRRADAEEQRA